MTQDQAKIYYWGLITRAQRVGFPIPEKWLRYGYPPDSQLAYMNTALRAVFTPERIARMFELDMAVVSYLRRRE